MEINKANYEAFLLDLWEGNLSEDQKVLLYSFLEKHPELDEGDALDLLDDVSETIPNITFDKDALNFENINDKNYEYFFIAYLEGDLSESQMNNVDIFLTDHPGLDKKFDQFKRARLTEENSIVSGSVEKGALQFETINTQNYQHLFVAYWEGDLTTDQMNEVETFVANHSELSKEFDQYKRAKLPFEVIEYPHKGLLFSDSTPVISLQSRWLIGITAAAVALFFLFTSPLNNVENKYSMNGDTKITYDEHESDPFMINQRDKINAPKNKKVERTNLTQYAKNIEPRSIESKDNTNTPDNDPKIIVDQQSRVNIKANGFSNVVASLNKKVSNNIEEIDPKKEITTQEKIPTILEYTTAYLQRKSVLNEEKKPNLKGLLNSTLASNNNDQPVLETTEGSSSKRTVFKLGDFKFERIAKK